MIVNTTIITKNVKFIIVQYIAHANLIKYMTLAKTKHNIYNQYEHYITNNI